VAFPLALHTWTLDSTPLADVLRIITRVGWDAVELRRIDFKRAIEAGGRAEDVLALVRESGVRVACVGVELGWMFAEGDEHRRLRDVFAESCRWAQALDCRTVMSPVDRGRGDLGRAVDRVHEMSDVAGKHGVRLDWSRITARAEELTVDLPTNQCTVSDPHGAEVTLQSGMHVKARLVVANYQTRQWRAWQLVATPSVHGDRDRR